MGELQELLGARSGLLILVALMLGLGAAVLSAAVFFQVRKLTRPAETHDVVGPNQMLASVLKVVEEMRKTTEDLRTRLDRHVADSRSFVRHVGLVRFNAFDDIGGQQSYTLCLLDSQKTGVLITFLAARNSTRSYLVPVNRGTAPRELSDEEEQALDNALAPDAAPAELTGAARI